MLLPDVPALRTTPSRHISDCRASALTAACTWRCTACGMVPRSVTHLRVCCLSSDARLSSCKSHPRVVMGIHTPMGPRCAGHRVPPARSPTIRCCVNVGCRSITHSMACGGRQPGHRVSHATPRASLVFGLRKARHQGLVTRV